MQKRLINVEELAEYLGIKVNTVYSWIHIRKIPFVKMGRLLKFDLKEIDKWVEDQKVEPIEI